MSPPGVAWSDVTTTHAGLVYRTAKRVHTATVLGVHEVHMTAYLDVIVSPQEHYYYAASWTETGGRNRQFVGAPPGFGAVALPNPQNLPVVNAANDLINYLTTNGCSQASLPVVSAFQSAYNSTGLPGSLTVDGQYGGNTMRALQNVMDQAQANAGAGPAQQAPADCFQSNPTYGPEPTTPQPDVTPSGPGTLNVPETVVTGSTTDYTPYYVVGGVAAAAAVAAGIYYAKRRKRH